MVRLCTLMIALLAPAWAADTEYLALVARAEAPFRQVENTNTPTLLQVEACVQMQASWIPVAAPEDLPVAHYRKGYCRLAGAAITRNANEFREAANDLDKAVET